MSIEKYLGEMSTVTKIVLGSVFVIVVGFIVTSGEESAQEKQSMAFLRGREFIVEYARGACRKSIKDHLSSDIGYAMSETDPMATAVTLTWRGNGKEFTSIVCNYHKDKGVTRLSIDGVEKFALSAGSPETGSTVEAEKTGEQPAVETGTVEAP